MILPPALTTSQGPSLHGGEGATGTDPSPSFNLGGGVIAGIVVAVLVVMVALTVAAFFYGKNRGYTSKAAQMVSRAVVSYSKRGNEDRQPVMLDPNGDVVSIFT